MAGGSWVERRGTKGRERWIGRVPLPNGTAPWVPLSEPGEKMSAERAKSKLAALIEMGTTKGNLEALVARLRERLRARRSMKRELVIGTTVREFGEAWTNGDLLKKHGQVNRLRVLKDAETNAWRLRKHVYPKIGDRSVASITEQDIEALLASLADDLDAESKIRIYSVLTRLFDLAIMPGRLRKDSPVTKYHRPPRGEGKVFSYLYPTELLAMLRHREIPIGRRVLYALAVYTGLRKGSLYALRWRDIDLDGGTVAALVTKNGEPQHFALFFEGLRIMLIKWWVFCGKPKPDELVIRGVEIEERREAEALRGDLKLVGVTRAILFPENEQKVEPLRFHDLRATFVTWCKRAGYAESFITDRSGHLDSKMVTRYARAARALEDLQLVPFPNIANEIAGLPTDVPTSDDSGGLMRGGGGNGGGEAPKSPKNARHIRVVDPVVAGSSPVTHPENIEESATGPGRSGVEVGNSEAADPIESVLAKALAEASTAGRWDVVGQLARELEARRAARAASVIDLDRERRKRGDR